MRRFGLIWLLVPGIWGMAALAAEPASASRPFSHVTLHHQSTNPGLHNWLTVKTVRGPDKPRTVSVKADGITAPAREIRRAPGHWTVNRQTIHGRALIRALRADLHDSGVVTLAGVGRYKCGATYRVSFRITEYNERAPSHFEDAALCL